jgi:hypothetical protein
MDQRVTDQIFTQILARISYYRQDNVFLIDQHTLLESDRARSMKQESPTGHVCINIKIKFFQ